MTLSARSRRRPVVIVGAGPTGVTAATLLAQYGVELPGPRPLARRVPAATCRAPGRRDLPHHRPPRHRRRVRRDLAAHAGFAPARQPIHDRVLAEFNRDPARSAQRVPAGQHVRSTGIGGAAARKPQAVPERPVARRRRGHRRQPTSGERHARHVHRPHPTAKFTRSTPTTCWAATAPTAWCAPRSAPPCGI